jgi:IclR family KDG regulon transcriptional repressor
MNEVRAGSSDRYNINSIVRACAILRTLARDNESLRVGEIAKRMELDRTTVYRIVITLENLGFLEKRPGTKEYKLGLGAFEVGSSYLRTTDLYSVARPIMIELAQDVQEAVHWAILSGHDTICIDKIDSPRGLGTTSKVGRSAPLHCSSVGKVLLAFQSEERREAILGGIKLTPFTERTITSVAVLREEADKARRRGYCVTYGEGEIDMACIAGPIFDHSGSIVAGLSIGGPIHRMSSPEAKSLMIRRLLSATRRISEKMGCPEPPAFEDAA